MKKIILTIVFALIFYSAFGQTLPENRWILGTWQGIDSSNNTYYFTFNENGTGQSGGTDIIYSLNGAALTIFSLAGTSLRTSITVFRINDQRMVFFFRSAGAEWYVNLNKVD